MADLLAQLQEKGTKHIFVDMAELEFLSSAGVGSILGSVETSREMGGDIILFNLSENIRHVIEVLDLQDFFTIAANRQNAIEATKL
jgi:anti-anti-sigma factor